MKLFIQIPCFNEENNIAETIRSLPRHMEGVDEVKIIVIDDGSNDNTAAQATHNGADKILRLPRHKGLADAFSTGIEYALSQGADIVVNTDADLQYPSEEIPSLIQPILENHADIAVGDRLHKRPGAFPFWKMTLERLGSFTVRLFSRVDVNDAASGFRAFNRDAMEMMYIHSSFSYTIESLILAGLKRLRVANVAVTINKTQRSSRLYNSVFGYVSRTAITVVRTYLMYHPLSFFLSTAFLFLGAASVLGVRYLYFFMIGEGTGHVQSLILLTILSVTGFLCIVLGLLGDVIAANRRLLEDIRRRMREKYLDMPCEE